MTVWCDECCRSFVSIASPRESVEQAIAQGWTTDGNEIHCPTSPALEISGIVQAKAMVHHTDPLFNLYQEVSS